jgi:hypothetical protein
MELTIAKLLLWEMVAERKTFSNQSLIQHATGIRNWGLLAPAQIYLLASAGFCSCTVSGCSRPVSHTRMTAKPEGPAGADLPSFHLGLSLHNGPGRGCVKRPE